MQGTENWTLPRPKVRANLISIRLNGQERPLAPVWLTLPRPLYSELCQNREDTLSAEDLSPPILFTFFQNCTLRPKQRLTTSIPSVYGLIPVLTTFSNVSPIAHLFQLSLRLMNKFLTCHFFLPFLAILCLEPIISGLD